MNAIEELNINKFDDEFDFEELFGIFFRNKKLIGYLSFIGIIFSIFYSFSLPKIWQGDFQIVLTQNKNTKKALSEPSIYNLFSNAGSGLNDIKTEVEILKSPSVLMPIYEFVNSENLEKSYKNTLPYQIWLESKFKIEVIKGTSVLNLSYKDKDKEQILDVLNKISSAYQDYSNRDRTRNLETGRDYISKQIPIYMKKSLNSTLAAQKFAIENDLIDLSGQVAGIDQIASDIGIDNKRIEASINLRLVNKQIDQFNEISNDPEKLISFSRNELFRNDSLLNQIDKNSADLAKKRIYYKENDDVVQSLIKEKNILTQSLKDIVYDKLYAARKFNIAMRTATDRSQEVLLKYKTLFWESLRDNVTLRSLENEYRTIELDIARSEDPWELITKPTLMDRPIAPRKKIIVLLITFATFVVSFLASIILEKKTNKVFSKKSIKTIFSQFPSFVLNTNNKKSWAELISLLTKENDEIFQNKNINFILIGEINKNIVNDLKNTFKQVLPKIDICTSSRLSETKKDQVNYVLTQIGGIKYNELKDLKIYLELNNNPLEAFFIIS